MAENKINLIPQEKDGKWGYVDDAGNWVIAPRFIRAYPFVDGLARIPTVYVESIWEEEDMDSHDDETVFGFINESGEWAIEPRFQQAFDFVNGIARVRVDCMWGYIDREGNWIFEPTLVDAKDFCGEYAKVQDGVFLGIINRKGEWVKEPSPDNAEAATIDNADWPVPKHIIDKSIFFDSFGDIAIDFQYDFALDFSEGCAAVCAGDLWGYIDIDGNWLIKPTLAHAESFEDGVAIAAIQGETMCDGILEKVLLTGTIDHDGNWIMEPRQYERVKRIGPGLISIEKDGLSGMVDIKGNILIEPQFDVIYNFHGDYTSVKKNNKVGLIDRNGNILVKPAYNSVSRPYGNGLYIISNGKLKKGLIDRTGKVLLKPAYDNMSFDSNGLIIIEADGKFGWLNEKYELLAGRMFDKYQDSDDDGSISDMIWETIAVEADGLWGILRRDGSWLAEPQFDTIDNLDSEFIRASVANHWGFIDRNGEWTVDPIFDQIKPFSNEGMAPAKTFAPKLRAVKWGMVNPSGHWAINPQFDDLEPFVNGLARAKVADKWGYIDIDGNWAIPAAYDKAEDFIDEVAIVAVGKKKGIINRNGEWVAEPKYDSIGKFYSGVAKIKSGKAYGYIDITGKILVEPHISDLWIYDYGFSWAQYKRKWGLLNRINGHWLIEPQFEDISPSSSLTWVKLNGKWGYIDKHGNWLIPAVCDENHSVHYDSNPVELKVDGKYGIYDILKSEWILPPEYKIVNVYKRVSIVQSDGKYGLYNHHDRHWIVEPSYDGMNLDGEFVKIELNGKFGWLNLNGELFPGQWFDGIDWSFDKHGIACVRIQDKCGLIATDGSWVTEPIFDRISKNKDYITAFKDNKVRMLGLDGRMLFDQEFEYVMRDSYSIMDSVLVSVNRKRGIIDLTNKVLIEPRFSDVGFFYGDRSCVELDGKWGFIDRSGNWAIPPIFEYAYDFNMYLRDNNAPGASNSARVKVNGKVGLIDRDGNWLAEPIYDEIESFNDDMAVVKLDGKCGYINRWGEIIVEPKYNTAHEFKDGCGEVGYLRDCNPDTSNTHRGKINGAYEYFWIDKTGKEYNKKPHK